MDVILERRELRYEFRPGALAEAWDRWPMLAAFTHDGARVWTIVAGAGDDPPLKPAWLVPEIKDPRTGPQLLIVGRVPAADQSHRGSADRPAAARRAKRNGSGTVTPDVVVVAQERVGPH